MVQATGHKRGVKRRGPSDLPRVDRPLVVHLADVDDVREEPEEVALVEGPALARASLARDPRLQRPAPPPKLGRRGDERALPEVEVEDAPHALGFRLVHVQPPTPGVR